MMKDNVLTLSRAIFGAGGARLACGASLLALMLTVGCGDQAPPTPDAAPEKAKPKYIDPTAATPEQEKALANPLHVAHLEDEEEPSKCRDCHQIKGKEPVDPGHRCMRCHDELKSAMHNSVANEEARECQTCHEWLEEDIEPWACQGCHTNATDVPKPTVEVPDATKIVVHAEEACNTCHLPHGDEAIKLGECLECHEEQTSSHHPELGDPGQCAECHQSHEPAKAAYALCADCHRNDVNTRVALFEGHDDCQSCHQPHERNGVVACQSCHEDVRTVGMRTTPEHRDCTSCHNPHQVTRSPQASCIGCHEDVQVQHPEDEKDGTCVGCHPSHPFRGRLVLAKECSTCHEEAATETSFHSGESCGDCHRPHGFSLESAGQQLCSDCHLKDAPRPEGIEASTIQVQPIEDHSNCIECHVDSAHEPTKQTSDCGTCHEPQVQTMTPGHEACADCHMPHEGTVETTCKSCHEDKWTSRHVTDGQNCEQCHRSHGPEGPAEPQACRTCHEEALPLLHQHAEHQNCADCHDFHDKGPQRARSTCLGSCHQDLLDHEPDAVSCVGCHPFENDVPDWLRVEEVQ